MHELLAKLVYTSIHRSMFKQLAHHTFNLSNKHTLKIWFNKAIKNFKICSVIVVGVAFIINWIHVLQGKKIKDCPLKVTLNAREYLANSVDGLSFSLDLVVFNLYVRLFNRQIKDFLKIFTFFIKAFLGSDSCSLWTAPRCCK